MRTRRRAAAALPLLVSLVLGTTSCGFLSDEVEPGVAETSAPGDPGAGSGDVRGDARPALLDDEARLTRAVRGLLRERAAALRGADGGAVLAGVADDPDAQRAQRVYADNVAALPVATFRYVTGDAVLSPDPAAGAEGEVRVGVDLRTRLRRLDTGAVSSPREMVLAVDGDDLRLVSDVPALADPSAGGAQPWDLGPVTTVTRGGVLGVFDAGAPDAAAVGEAVVDEAADAADDVAAVVPYRWSGDVAVYGPSDTTLLRALGGLPAGVADGLDGVAFGVRPADGGPDVAERVLLHPRMLRADEAERDRLLRHELTHVALSGRDDGVPRWLSEGLAEWVSVQPLRADERLISMAALRAARRGVETLPPDDSFSTGARSGADYGIAWQACEEVAAVYGEDALWTLLEAMGARGDRSPEAVLETVLGTTGDDLAAQASDRIVSAYG